VALQSLVVTRTKAELKEYASAHLKYDVLQVRAAHYELHRVKNARGVRNAALESFATRTRVLLEFYFEKRVGMFGARARHFCKRGAWKPVPAAVFKDIHWRVNTEIVHASFKRLDLSAETGRWPTTKILKELDALALEFATQCRPGLLDEEAREVLMTPTFRTITSSAVNFAASSLSWTFPDLPDFPPIAADLRIDGNLEATTSP
jgi:hypothetical protein